MSGVVAGGGATGGRGGASDSTKLRFLHVVWKEAVARGLTDREAVHIMLDHLENCKCTPEYYLYMWLQRLQATHSQISAWTTGLPRFDEELLAEIHALCQPDGYLHNSEFGPGTVRGGDALPPGGRVPASTQAETAKRDGRKLIRLVLNNPKISICAHINDPLSPTLLLTAAALTIKKTPAPFFSPDFVDRGEDHASYYDCTDITMSSTLCFVASRDYLYHCMRNHKLSELRILREPTTLQIRVRGLAVPKPIFVGMARERYSVSCSNLALCFSKDRPLKLLSVIRSFLNHSDVCRKRPRDPNDLPGAIHYECTCPLLSVEHSGGGVTIRLNASACALKLVSHTPVINEGCTRSLRISHTSRRAPLQPVSKTQVPCTPYHPPDIAGVRSTPDNNPAYVLYVDYCRVLLSQVQPRWLNIEPASPSKSTKIRVGECSLTVGDSEGLPFRRPSIASAHASEILYKSGLQQELECVVADVSFTGLHPHRNTEVVGQQHPSR
jgi:hypothetical protein